jgi:hypothetical protein
MKKVSLAISIFVTVFATSCNKCGFCNAPFANIDINAAKVCKGGNKTEYNAAVAECENRGSGWYWDILEK